jgi:hypothetical protein
MGSCCGSNAVDYHYPDVKKSQTERYKLPRIIVTSQDVALIYLEVSLTPTSEQLKYFLKRKFPTLVSYDGEKRIIKMMEMMDQRKCYIIVGGYIHEETIRSMLRYPKVKSIYFCLEQINLGHFSKSTKIKGFFNNQMDLEKAIYHDLRSDESC